MRAALALALCLTTPAGAEIVAARYDDPTTRYPHGVLGDRVEHATLAVTLASGGVMRATWPPGVVFEDTAPRLADLDGDGAAEVIVVESHADLGARLAIWGLDRGRLVQRAATPFIGTRFRWLAPVGAADLDRDGRVEIAYVDRPHLARVLRVVRVVPGEPAWSLVPVAALEGVTNHRIGEPEISGGIRDCGGRPEMIVMDAAWASILAVRLLPEAWARPVAPYRGPASVAAVLACR